MRNNKTLLSGPRLTPGIIQSHWCPSAKKEKSRHYSDSSFESLFDSKGLCRIRTYQYHEGHIESPYLYRARAECVWSDLTSFPASIPPR